MSEDLIKSKAFHRAALKSEWYRIVGLLGLLCAFMLYAIARGLTTGESRLMVAQGLVLALAMACEGTMLVAVKRALQKERDIPRSMWLLSVLIETQLPTIALFLLIQSRLMARDQALV